jgi:branched-chain amino acid transport system permease protein
LIGAFIIEPLANLTSTSLRGADAGGIRLLLFGGLLGAVVLFLPRDVFPTVTGYWRRKQARQLAPGERAPADPGAAAVPDHGPRQDGDARQDGADDALEARGLVKTFDGLRAVDGADLVVAAARVTGLIGPNDRLPDPPLQARLRYGQREDHRELHDARRYPRDLTRPHLCL